jgi:2-amino-4-hydroxy-6-hydroxymethyldihydropteridine diphosphokinase
VLAPLAEIAPELFIPGRGAVRELLARCADQQIEKLVPQTA